MTQQQESLTLIRSDEEWLCMKMGVKTDHKFPEVSKQGRKVIEAEQMLKKQKAHRNETFRVNDK